MWGLFYRINLIFISFVTLNDRLNKTAAFHGGFSQMAVFKPADPALS